MHSSNPRPGAWRPHSPTAVFSVVFVCTGNICRSPIAEVIYRQAIEDAHLSDLVDISSAGTGGWHAGQPADHRAVAELAAAGYDGAQHRAQQVTAEQLAADLLVALDSGHVTELVRLGVPREKIRMLRSFDRTASSPDVEDPYYGSAADFTQARRDIESAMPGLVAFTRQWCDDISDR